MHISSSIIDLKSAYNIILRSALAGLLVLALGACSFTPQSLEVANGWINERIIAEAETALLVGDFGTGLAYLNMLEERYPGQGYLQQSIVNAAYTAASCSCGSDKLLPASDQFLAQSPKHPLKNYMLYFKAMVAFYRYAGPFEQEQTTQTEAKQIALDSFQQIIDARSDNSLHHEAEQRLQWLLRSAA